MQPAPAPDMAPLSEPARLAAVFFDPKRAFSDIAAHPRWWPPLLISVLVATIFVSLYSSRVGWERYLERALESNPRTESLTAEQRHRIIEQQMPLVTVVSYAGAVVGTVVTTLVAAGALLFAANFLGSTELAFRPMFAVTCYAFLPNALAGLLGILMMFLKHPEDFDLENPTAFNVGAYLDPAATPKWLVAVASSIDLFSIWVILLLALGISTAARKTSYGRALATVVGLWATWVVLKALRYALL
ncbi:MAG: YIP1 family protein [Bryobacteraceae bacterium]